MKTNRSKIRLVAGISMVFFVGVLAGGLGAGVYFEARIEKMVFHGPPRGDRFIERLTQDLDLSPIQVKEIRPIIQDLEEKSFTIKGRFFQQIKPLLDESRKQIRLKLNDEQTIKFDKIHEKMKKGVRQPPLFPPPGGPPFKPS